MLSSPDAKGSKAEGFSLGQQSIGCEARHDLVFARARVNLQMAPPLSGATREDRATAERSRAEPAF